MVTVSYRPGLVAVVAEPKFICELDRHGGCDRPRAALPDNATVDGRA